QLADARNPMQPEQSFRVWGTDHVVYGPLGLSSIAEWLANGRINSESWVFSDSNGEWRRAQEWPEVREILKKAPVRSEGAGEKKADEERRAAAEFLRELDLFKGLTDAQIESFTRYSQIVRVSQFTRIARKGEPGDSMFIVLEGEV